MSTPSDASSDGAVPAVVFQHWKRNVAFFLTGQTVSLFGSMIVQYAVMWYVTFLTQSGLAVALYAVAAFAPQGIVSIFGGVWADRVNRRLLVMGADATIAATTLVLALLMLNGVTDLWIILLAVAVRSVGAGIQTPAVQAMIPQIAPPDQLMRVNGFFQTVQSAMALLAPAAAGAVYGIFGLVPVFFIDVVTAIIGIVMLSFVTVPTLAVVASKSTSYRADLAEGMRFIWHHPFVRWLMLVFAIIFLLTVALGLSPTLWVFYGFMFGFGLFVPLFSAPFMTLVQESIAPEMQGRVFSYVTIIMALATPIGMTVFGPLADIVSVQTLLVGGGIATVLVIGTAMLVPSGRAAMAAAARGGQGVRAAADELGADESDS